MRKVFEEQLKLGEVDVSRIEFDPKSRDGIPQLQTKEREYEKRSRSIRAALARKCVAQAA